MILVISEFFYLHFFGRFVSLFFFYSLSFYSLFWGLFSFLVVVLFIYSLLVCFSFFSLSFFKNSFLFGRRVERVCFESSPCLSLYLLVCIMKYRIISDYITYSKIEITNTCFFFILARKYIVPPQRTAPVINGGSATLSKSLSFCTTTGYSLTRSNKGTM